MSTAQLTGKNPYALSTSTQISYASKNANAKSASLTTGTKEQSVVEIGISNKLAYDNNTLTVVNKNMTYQKSQLKVMQNSLSRMKETASKMNEVVISSFNKSKEQRTNLTNTLNTYVDLLNKQINDANFGDKNLLGGEHYNTAMRVGVESGDVYNMQVGAINTSNNGKQVVELYSHDNTFGGGGGVGTPNNADKTARIEAYILYKTGATHNANNLNTAMKAIAEKVAHHGVTAIDNVREDMRAAFEKVRNNQDPSTADLANAEKANIGKIIEAGPEMIALTIDMAIAAKAAGGDADAAKLAAYNAASEFKLHDDAASKNTEKVIKNVVDLIDSKLTQVNAYLDSVDSISESLESKIQVTTETLDAYSKADIVKTAQEFQEFLTKLKLSLQVLASGQRLTDEAMVSVRSSLQGS